MPRGAPRLRTSDGKKNEIGGRIKARRGALDLTQDGLSARLADITSGVWVPDFQEIYRIESGKRIVTTLELIALAKALDSNPCWLLLGTTDLSHSN